ncbi:MAG TPA: trypsin-like peptidase domain-containing protein [Casimicrobiaceae bacterium]|jgi:hypothetical protein
MTRVVTRLASGLAVLSISVAALAAGITAVPPAQYRPTLKAGTPAPSLLLPATSTSRRITLAEPSSSERNAFKALNAKQVVTSPKAAAGGDKARPLAVAFGRAIPGASQVVALDMLAWQSLPDGSRAARIEVQSTGAAALRVEMRLPAVHPDVEVRFAGTGDGATVFAPIPANAVAADTARYGSYWSPVVRGDTAVIELHAPADAVLAGTALTLTRVSHQAVDPARLKSMSAKDVSDIGRSGTCNIDVVCVTPVSQAFVNASSAVAEILFTQENGNSYLCTGTLLNDSVQSFTPYFFSANHCINSATAARTINTFWFFQAAACTNPRSTAIPNYIQQISGAALLARSEDWDWALVRLNELPPAGTFFSAWRSDPIPTGADIQVFHHPSGDLKKWSAGTMPGVQSYSDGSSFWFAHYTQGTTETGSSGAGLLTFNADPAAQYYEVRGGLFGGDASCSNLDGLDQYSQLGNMLPKVREYLTPGSDPAGTAAAVEFYNRSLDHYFISTNPAEINDLDTGVHVGWERTGLRFNAYNVPLAGTSPVCRFYRAPAFGDSHFYSASPTECAETAAAHPIDWIYESPNVFYIFLPDPNTGACPASTQPVWRFFNQVTTNHRYTTDVATHDDMVADPLTWVPEGYGPDAVIMCAPLGA